MRKCLCLGTRPHLCLLVGLHCQVYERLRLTGPKAELKTERTRN